MSLIDRLKATHASIVNRALPQRVVFHHTPKCGGTSVARALRKRYFLSQATVLPEESYRAYEAFCGQTDRGRMLIDVLDLREQMFLYLLYSDIRCVSLHVRFSPIAHRLFRERYKFVTILREPVSRFISHYFFSHGKPAAHGRIDEGFAEFLKTPRAQRLGASYVEFYGGLPKDAPLDSPDSIAAALGNLRTFDVVGFLDDLSGFEKRIRECIGVRLRIGHENRGRQSHQVREATVSTDLRAEVERLCAPDLQIWRGIRL